MATALHMKGALYISYSGSFLLLRFLFMISVKTNSPMAAGTWRSDHPEPWPAPTAAGW